MIRILKSIKRTINRFGSRKKCYVCGTTFFSFYKYRGGTKNRTQWMTELNTVGSDLDNFGCLYCRAHDRERHLHMYFDKLNLWNKVKGNAVLHVAPERNLKHKIQAQQPSEYVKADLFPSGDGIVRMDITQIPFADGKFDLVICNHVLEHIPDHRRALSEIYRVLKHDGIAILQTPFSTLLTSNFEDPAINTDALRLVFYGQEDHVRVFSEGDLMTSFTDAGFVIERIRHHDLFNDEDATYFGVNPEEDLLMVRKP